MNSFRRYAAILLLFAGCGKHTTAATSTALPRNPGIRGWLVYEDDVFRVEYPPGSEVAGAVNGKQDAKRPMLGIVPPPAAGRSMYGALSLQPDSRTVGMLLRDALESKVRDLTKSRGTVITGPQEFKVTNGKCLGAIVLAPIDSCPKNHGSCFGSFYKTQCDAADGRRYDASTVMSDSTSESSLSPEAQMEAETYERMLNSLTFKNPPHG